MQTHWNPREIAVWLGVAAFVLDGTASAIAQVALPGVAVDLPRVPVPSMHVDTPRVNAGLDARRLRIDALRREHPDRLATDSHGDLIVRDEVLAQPSSQHVLDEILGRGYRSLHETRIEELGLQVVVLAVPGGTTLAKAMGELRKLDPDGRYDYHHVLMETGDEASPRDAQREVTAASGAEPPPSAVVGQKGPMILAPLEGTPGRPLRIGMIDGGVLAKFDPVTSVSMHHWGCDGGDVPSAHGTAVASLIGDALRARDDASPARDDSQRSFELFAADVYCNAPTGGAVDAVIEALAWLTHERVPVINVSLVGPPNTVLERVVARLVARGHLIVAAVGNDGPAAPPLYPAAYAGVVAVTGVDRRGHVLLEAGRGPMVEFAALGADVEASTLSGGRSAVRGTSFAAPTVAALLALRLQQLDVAAANAAVTALATTAVDLGAPGRDPIYGYGWVKAEGTAGLASSAVVPDARR